MQVLDPDQLLTSVGFCLNAADVYGQDVSPRTISVTGYGEVIDSTGHWVGPTESGASAVGYADGVLISDVSFSHPSSWRLLPGLSASFTGDKVLRMFGSMDTETVYGATTWFSTIEYHTVAFVSSGETVDIRIRGYTDTTRDRVVLEVGIFVGGALDTSKRHVVYVGSSANQHTAKAGSYMRALVYDHAP
jgi:hypothetical protein